MRIVNHKQPVDFTGHPDLAHLGLVKKGQPISVDALDPSLRRLGFGPLQAEDVGAESVDVEALREALETTKGLAEAHRAAEQAALGRVDALRLKVRDLETAKGALTTKVAELEAQVRGLTADRDAAIDRLASAGGEGGRPWLEAGNEDRRLNLVNEWRAEAEPDAKAYSKLAYADAWLYRQPDAAVAERWAAQVSEG